MGFTDANRSEVLSQSFNFNPNQEFYVGGGQLGNIGPQIHQAKEDAVSRKSSLQMNHQFKRMKLDENQPMTQREQFRNPLSLNTDQDKNLDDFFSNV